MTEPIPLKKALEEGSKKARQRLTLVMASECTYSLDDLDLVEGVIPDKGLVALYGASNCGKSFLAINLGFHIALGIKWHGQDTEQGAVLYIATESPHGVVKRIEGFKKHYGQEAASAPLALVKQGISLFDYDVADQVAGLAENLRERTGSDVRLIIIDTFSYAMAGGDENASSDVMKAMNALQEIIRQTGATVLIVHHTGKETEKGLRGSSALLAALDTSIEVKEEGGQRTAWIRKQRDGETGRGLPFSLGVVELGTNPKGHLKTTCYVEHGEGWVEADKRKKLTDRQRRALKAIEAALEENGEPSPGFRDMPSGNVQVVQKRIAVTFIANKMDATETKRRNEQAHRAIQGLVAKEVAGVAGDYIWLIR